MSKRGKGTCLSCQHEYANKYKPEFCECGFYYGGKYVPSAAAAKKAKSIPFPDAVEVITNVYSSKTSSRNDRCLTVREGLNWICLHPDCLKNRAVFVSGERAEMFACKHVNLVKSGPVSKPLDIWTPTDFDIGNYEAGDIVQTQMKKVVESLKTAYPAVITVCEDRFVVYGSPTATNTIGYCHVRKEGTNLLCASKDCKACVARCKKRKQKGVCLHLHLLLLYNKVTQKVFSELPDDQSVQEPSDPRAVAGPSSQSDPPAPQPATEYSSASRKATIKVIPNRALPYEIPKETICLIDRLDVITLLGVPNQGGWPLEFAPEEGKCDCGSVLGSLRYHPGSNGEVKGKAYLFTKMNPFRMASIYVRQCTGCKAMHQADTLKMGETILFLTNFY